MASYNWDVRNFENRGREGMRETRCMSCLLQLYPDSCKCGPGLAGSPHACSHTAIGLQPLPQETTEAQRHPALTAALCEGRARRAGPPC